MDSNLPKLTSTNDNQILIHPDHAEGKLLVPIITESKPQQNHKLINIFAVFAILFLFSILAFGYYFIPKTRVVIFADTTAETITEVGSITAKVDKSLNQLYVSITASSAGEDTGLNEISTNVLSANTSASTNTITASSLQTLSAAKAFVLKNGRVKAFSVPESDPNKIVREQRKIAEKVGTTATEAKQTTKEKLATLNFNNLPKSANSLQTEVNNLGGNTQKYLTESERTSKYYVTLSDAGLELYEISSSISQASDIKNSISDLSVLRDKFASYDKTQLPSEIGDLNTDVIGIFDLLIKFFRDVDSGTLDTEAKVESAYNVFLVKTQALSAQTTTHELNFWQNNKTLSSHKELSEKYAETIKKAQELKATNNYFLTSALGVD